MAKQILDWNYNPIQEKDIPKQKHTIFYEYDNPEEALTDLSNLTSGRSTLSTPSTSVIIFMTSDCSNDCPMLNVDMC